MQRWEFTEEWYGTEGKLRHQGRTAHLRHIEGANKTIFSVTEEGTVICEGSTPTLLSSLLQAEAYILKAA